MRFVVRMLDGEHYMLKLLSGNEKGMSLVEVTVAAAISVVIAMGVMKINETSVKGMQTIQEKSEIQEFRNIVNGNLVNAEKCRASNFASHDWKDGGTTTPADGVYPPTAAGTPQYRASSSVSIAIATNPAVVSKTISTAANNTLPWTNKWGATEIRYYNRDTAGVCHILIKTAKKAKGNAGFGAQSKNIWIALDCDINNTTGAITSCSGENAVAEGYFQDNDGVSGGAITGKKPIIIGLDNTSVADAISTGLYVGDATGTRYFDHWSSGPASVDSAISVPDNHAVTFGNDEDYGVYYDGSNLVMSGAGNVGIGVTNPTSALSVSGDISSTGNVSSSTISTSGNATIAGSINGATISATQVNGVTLSAGNITADEITSTNGLNSNTLSVSSTGSVGGMLTSGNLTTGVVNSNTIVNSGDATVTGDIFADNGWITGDLSANDFTANVVTSGTVRATSALIANNGGSFNGDLIGGISSTIEGESLFMNQTVAANKIIATSEVHSPGFYGGDFHGTSYLTSSDKRYKKQIKRIRNASEKLSEIVGVTYFMRRDEFPKMDFPSTKQVGLIAQNVEKQFPELVITNKLTGMKSVQYSNFVAILVEGFKEQQKAIDANRETLEVMRNGVSQYDTKQDSRIDELEKENNALKDSINILFKRIELLESRK